MTQVVTVHTDFTDLNQMAQGLLGRVDATRVILPHPTPVETEQWVQFAVNLQDGTPGLAGVGRCVTSVDNGEAHPAQYRYDVVIDSLQFDERGQDIYQHILLLGQQIADPEAATAAEPPPEQAPEAGHEEPPPQGVV